jgi:MFS family permease
MTMDNRRPAAPTRGDVTYLGELRVSWRYLSGASLGLASGYLLTMYITSVFVPHLMTAFGWSKSQMSAAGAAAMLSLITLPIAGRLTDRFGVRPIAIAGVIGTPLVFLAFSAMTGNFSQYLWLNVAQVAVMGMTTSSVVYGRVVAEQFTLARGLALAIAGSSPALAGAVVAPFLAAHIAAHGWRAGYVAVAVGTAIGGVLALILIPMTSKATSGKGSAGHAVETTDRPKGSEFLAILRSFKFQIIFAGLFLCNISIGALASQLVVIMLDRGITLELATYLVSLLAVGVVAGRFVCGLALDRFPAHLVIAISLGLPGVGLFVLASGLKITVLIVGAVSLLGLAMGAEINIIPYLAMRYFRIGIFSTVIGMLASAVGSSQAVGSLILSLSLKLTGSYTGFLFGSAVAAVAGSALFLLLGRPAIRDAVV